MNFSLSDDLVFRLCSDVKWDGVSTKEKTYLARSQGGGPRVRAASGLHGLQKGQLLVTGHGIMEGKADPFLSTSGMPVADDMPVEYPEMKG